MNLRAQYTPYAALVAIFFLIALDNTVAAETDNITYRPTAAGDLADTKALDSINEKTNQLLNTSLIGLKDCDLKKLHFAIKDTLAGGEVGKLEAWAIKNPSLKKVTVPYGESIYANAGLNTGSGGLFLMGIAPSLVLGGHSIGTDKLGHFFDQGYDYYEAIYVHHSDPGQTIESMGFDDENDVNGMKGNGIRSYADMATNFSGYLFWREVAGGTNPYFACTDGKFVRTARKFNWAEYASDSWDEGINCSEFSDSVGAAVKKALGQLKVTCPVDPAICEKIAQQTCGFTFISPACLPYVKFPSYPDSACLHLIQVDNSEAQACHYDSGFTRRSTIKTILDLADGAGSVATLRSNQALNWATRKKNATIERLVKTLKKLNL